MEALPTLSVLMHLDMLCLSPGPALMVLRTPLVLHLGARMYPHPVSCARTCMLLWGPMSPTALDVPVR